MYKKLDLTLRHLIRRDPTEKMGAKIWSHLFMRTDLFFKLHKTIS